MNIQQAGERSGLSADTIRFYERRGVLPKPPRRANGYRDYTEEHVATLRLVRGLREIGLPLVEMEAIACVAHDGTCGDIRTTLMATLDEVMEASEERIRQIERTRSHVSDLLKGLARMKPSEDRVPGTTPCRCVELMGVHDHAQHGG